jgi:hypothetical protein
MFQLFISVNEIIPTSTLNFSSLATQKYVNDISLKLLYISKNASLNSLPT